jgi:hypothetical protein
VHVPVTGKGFFEKKALIIGVMIVTLLVTVTVTLLPATGDAGVATAVKLFP